MKKRESTFLTFYSELEISVLLYFDFVLSLGSYSKKVQQLQLIYRKLPQNFLYHFAPILEFLKMFVPFLMESRAQWR